MARLSLPIKINIVRRTVRKGFYGVYGVYVWLQVSMCGTYLKQQQ